ncbi:MAG: hypothetical protein ACP5JH_07990 [Bacteroidota bacterium]
MKHLTVALFLCATTGFAQINVGASVFTQYDANVLGNYEKSPDLVGLASLNLGKDFGGNSWTVTTSYTGSYTAFRTYADHDFQLHALNLSSMFTFGKEDDEEDEEEPRAGLVDTTFHLLMVSLKGLGRFDKTTFDLYDHYLGSGTVELRYAVGAKSALRGIYTIIYKNFTNVPEVNNLENNVAIQGMFGIGGATRLFVDAGAGYKAYLTTTYDTTRFKQPGKGRGKGKGGFMNPQAGQEKIFIAAVESPSVSQVVFGGGIAQYWRQGRYSFFAAYHRRTNPVNAARYISQQPCGFGADEDIYDDRYMYQSHEFSGGVHMRVAWDISADIGGEYITKAYSRPALSLDGSQIAPQREDVRRTLEIVLSRDINVGSSSMTIAVGSSYVRNWSNDEYNKYDGYAISLSIDFSL